MHKTSRVGKFVEDVAVQVYVSVVPSLLYHGLLAYWLKVLLWVPFCVVQFKTAQCTWEGHSLDICCLPFPLCCKQRSHAVLTNQLGFCQDIGKCCSVSQAAGWSDCFEGHTGHSLSHVLHGEGLLQE